MKRKAFFFTLTSILLLTLLLFAASVQFNNRLTARSETIHARVMTLNDFLKDAETDIERGIYIAGFRAVLSAEEYIAMHGEYLNDSKAGLRELMLNGTLNNAQMELMKESTLYDWARNLEEEGQKIDAVFNITIINATFSQADPWTIRVDAYVSLHLTDKKKSASWNINKTLSSEISVIGLEDAPYAVESFGRVAVIINKTSYEGNYVSGEDAANLLGHTYNGYFTNSTGPSFLMRLEGNFSNSTYGIESLIDVSGFQQQGLQVYDRSIVDYVYFSAENTTNYRINGTPQWFKIDEQHLDKYQVAGLIS